MVSAVPETTQDTDIPRRYKSWESQQVIMNSNSCPFSMDIQKHSAGALVSCRRFDARCSMPPTSWEEMKMDFKSDRKSRIFHLLFDLTKLF